MSEYIIATEQLAMVVAKCRVNLVNADGTPFCNPREIAEAVDEPITLREIVRCRDCKHANESCSVCYRYGEIGDDMYYPEIAADGFCAWGERKVVEK